jgi:hypothetical protein
MSRGSVEVRRIDVVTPTVRFVQDGDRMRATAGTTTTSTYTRVNVRAEQEQAVRAEGARRLTQTFTVYTQEERETWAAQVAEADAYQADNAASVPFLDAFAGSRSITVAQAATIILANSAQYKAAAGAIIGAQSAILQQSVIPDDITDDRHWS